MFKPLTFSLSLALALGFAGVSQAGLFHNDGGCATCGLASPQGPVVSPQAPIASPQAVECAAPVHCGPSILSKCSGALSGFGSKCGGALTGFGSACGGALTGFGSKCGGALTGLGHGFGDLCTKLKPKPACYTYEWVLKKKKVHGGCGAPTCDTCGPVVVPSSQAAPSAQAAPQAWPAPQAGPSGQTTSIFGAAPYSTASAAGAMAPAPAPAPAGDEAPPAPEVGPQSSLLFSTPRGN